MESPTFVAQIYDGDDDDGGGGGVDDDIMHSTV